MKEKLASINMELVNRILWSLLILLCIVVGTVIYLIPRPIPIPVPAISRGDVFASVISVSGTLEFPVPDEETLENVLEALEGAQYQRTIFPTGRAYWQPEDEAIMITLRSGKTNCPYQFLALTPTDQYHRFDEGTRYHVICDGEELYWKIRALLPISEE